MNQQAVLNARNGYSKNRVTRLDIVSGNLRDPRYDGEHRTIEDKAGLPARP
jgi:hypothetical protein